MDYVAEIIGTYIFVSIILFVGQPVPIAATLLFVIYLTKSFSKASVNPAVSLSLGLRGDLSSEKTFFYIISEFVGGGLAYLTYKYRDTIYPP
uniref:Major intrinsic protein n=1 Tax=viral metagenome TaxID=1070528 RepID=A0A6C0JUP9_9ZZZZ